MNKNYNYTDVGGEHFPDTEVGSNLFYSIDIDCWIVSEAAKIDSVVWSTGTGLVIGDSFINGTTANVKLEAIQVGTFSVTCTITSSDGPYSQTKNVVLLLKVA